jgi:hypothetical protein
MELLGRDSTWTIDDERACVRGLFESVLADVVHEPDAKFTERDVLSIAMQWLAGELKGDGQRETLAHLRKAISSLAAP